MLIYKMIFNSSWPIDAIWWHRPWSTLTPVMAYWLMAASCFLNECWPHVICIFLHSTKCNITGSADEITSPLIVWILHFNIYYNYHIPRANELRPISSPGPYYHLSSNFMTGARLRACIIGHGLPCGISWICASIPSQTCLQLWYVHKIAYVFKWHGTLSLYAFWCCAKDTCHYSILSVPPLLLIILTHWSLGDEFHKTAYK